MQFFTLFRLDIWRVAVTVALLSPLCMTTASAQSDRYVRIDARDGLTPEVQQQYAEAVLGDISSRHNNRRIVILVSAEKGFDAEALVVPVHKQNLDIDITLQIQRGRKLREDVSVNVLELQNPRTLQRINQRTRVR